MTYASCTIAGRAGLYLHRSLNWSLRLWAAAFLLGLWAVEARAAAPPNDLCSAAEVIPSSGPFPYASSTQNVTDATKLGDPNPEGPDCLMFVSRSVWYVFTPAQSGYYRLSVSGDTATTVRDTVMAIYTSAGGCAGPFTEIDCNDDAGLTEPHLLKSAIARNLSAGTTYYVLVWVLGDEPPPPDMAAVQLRISLPAPPVNDTCAGAQVIPGNGPFPYLTTVTDTLLASLSQGEALPSCRETPYAERSVWYQFTPERTAYYSISTCVGTATTVYDTVMAIYSSANGCAGPLQAVACNDNGCGFRSDIKMTLSAGTTYYIAVYDTEQEPAISETDVQVRVTIPPEAITLAATSITSTGAVLNAVVRPNGLLTRWWFEWGFDTTFTGGRSSLRLLGGSIPEVTTNAFIAPIMSDTNYFFRVVATNLNGIAEGETMAFRHDTAQPILESPGFLENGAGFAFLFNGAPGQIYEAEVSTNLVDWGERESILEASPGLFYFLDAGAVPMRAKFYRILLP